MTKTIQQEQLANKLSKILKKGYTNFEKQDECTNAILFLRNNGITLKSGKEYYQEADTKDFIIEPTKTNVKKIAKMLETQFAITF